MPQIASLLGYNLIMRQLRIRLTDMVKGMGLLALCLVGIPLLILYGLYWLLSRSFLMMAGLVLVFSPVFLFFGAWFWNHWAGALVIAIYIILYLSWKLVGDQVTAALRARGWIRARGVKRPQSSKVR